MTDLYGRLVISNEVSLISSLRSNEKCCNFLFFSQILINYMNNSDRFMHSKYINLN